MPSPASKATPGQVGNWSIDPGTVELMGLEFMRLDLQADNVGSPEDPVGIEMQFSTARASSNQVAVALEVRAQAPTTVEVAVKAGTILTIDHADEPPSELDEEFAKIAAQMGPVILYPYIRELIADLTRRSGKGTITLPIYQVGTLFQVNPDEIRWVDDRQPTEGGGKQKAKKRSEARKPKAKT